MTDQVENFLPLLREAIADARAAGLGNLADVLEQASLASCTTSSELLSAIGQAIVGFLRAGGEAVPPTLVAKLNTCLQHVQVVWPGIRA